MRLDADKAVALDGRAQQVQDAAPVAPRMHEGKAVKTLRIGSDQARHAVIGDRIIGVKGGEQHAAGDAGRLGPAQIGVQRRIAVPRPAQAVAWPRMAVTIDDQRHARLPALSSSRP